MPVRSVQRPFLIALLIGLAAQALFSLHLTRPAGIVFDEIHYVPAARTLLALERPVNVEHPLLGKTLIAAGIALFGDNAVGWRAFSTVAGTATILAVFWMLWLLFGRVRTAAMGAGFAILNQMVFVQARIAMLDGFLAAFVLLAIAVLLWAMRGPARWTAWRVALSGTLLGLAVAVKWAAIPYCALAGLAVLFVRWRADRRGQERPWPGIGTPRLLLILGATSLAAYFATFWPALFYREGAVTLAGLIPLQFEMYRLQTQVLAAHTYQSDWWSWPLMLRPIWYLYEPIGGVQRGILLVGNPAILWGGLVAVAACGIAWWRSGAGRMLGLALLWAGSLGIYALIPKSLGFFYYYYLSSIFLAVALAAAVDRAPRWVAGGFTALAAALFVYFYPILSAAALDGPGAYQRWTWFAGWV